MRTHKLQEKRLGEKEVLASINPNSNSFNFEIWAIAVRSQMLAALEKRVHPEENNENITI
jgi:hypothetical protein